MPKSKLLVVDVAALGHSLVKDRPEFRPAETIFPAVTCTAQAAFRTAATGNDHGMVGNGLLFRDLGKVLFWEQSARLVKGRRIWEDFRARGKKVGLMFWQQSMGEAVDLVVTPAPIHKHSGGMIQDCYTQPAPLQEYLNEQIGRPFNLMNYWGPLASHKASDWIVGAVSAVMRSPEYAPDLLLTYIPHLDYDLQKYGPNTPQAQKSLDVLLGYLARLHAVAEETGYEVVVFGDYAMEQATQGAVFPNRALRAAGLFPVREIAGMAYTDWHTGRAFAVVDHQCAHVYCRDAAAQAEAKRVLSALPGVAEVLEGAERTTRGVDHPNAGELVLVAEAGTWFAYPWFEGKKEAPDYAGHVDIHNKPGYDPCELYFGWPPGTVSFDTRKIHGSHGNVGAGYEVAWSSTLPLAAKSILELAQGVERWMSQVP